MDKKKVSLNQYSLEFSLKNDPIFDPKLSYRQKQKPGVLLNAFLKALGLWEERKYFKGDKSESGEIKYSNSYMLYEEDCKELLKLFKKENETSFIRKGEIDKVIENGDINKKKLHTLRETIDLFIKLFEKYCEDKESYEEIKYRISAVTKIELLESLDILNDTKNYVTELINVDTINRDLDTVAAYGIDEKDLQCWAINFSKEIEKFMNNWKVYKDGMKLYRDNEFDEKLDRLTDEEKKTINNFIELFSAKLKEEKIMGENDSLSDATTLYEGKEKINVLNQNNQVKQILMEFANHPGFKLYTRLFNTVESSEEVLTYIRKPDNFFSEIGKKLSTCDILTKIYNID